MTRFIVILKNEGSCFFTLRFFPKEAQNDNVSLSS